MRWPVLCGAKKGDVLGQQLNAEVLEKIEFSQAKAENELLCEEEQKAEELELKLIDGEAKVAEILKEIEADSNVIHEEEMERREKLSLLQKELSEKQQMKALLAEEVESITAKAAQERRTQEEQQYDRTLKFQKELEKLRSELEAKVTEEVRNDTKESQ